MRKPPNFNSLARSYAWMEKVTFGPWLWRCRCAFLDELTNSRTALVLGDGDGRFTAKLLAENAIVLIDAVDASIAMLRALARNAGIYTGRVRIHMADARLWESRSGFYDLIVTHFFLDCLSTKEIASLAARVRSSVIPSAQWVVSEFAIPDGWFGWLVARPVVTGLYLAFWVLTGLSQFHLPNHRKALSEAGFSLEQEQHWLGGLLVSELWKPIPTEAELRIAAREASRSEDSWDQEPDPDEMLQPC